MRRNGANQNELKVLQEIENTLDPKIKVEKTQKLYTELGARTYCESKMAFHHHQALNSLENMELSNSKDELLELANFLFTRAY